MSSHEQDDSPATWYIRQQALLDVLTSLQTVEAVAALREQVLNVRSRLCAHDAILHTDQSDAAALVLPASYLPGELAQIAAAQTVGRAHYYLERLIKSLTEERHSPINDLNLNRWKAYSDIFTDSLWHVERRDNSGVHTAGYWGNFIPQIPYQMMQRYTRQGEWVLDTFAGLGTTLIEGQRLGRNVLGVELQPDITARAQQLIAAEPNPYQVVSHVQTGDSLTVDWSVLLSAYGQDTAQLVIMHPPYFDIIKFSTDARDLSNAPAMATFLEQMAVIVRRVAAVLDQGRYLVLVIGDKYARGEWLPLGFRTMDVVLECGFRLKSIVVKNFEQTTGKRQQKELWRYRALVGGFYIFKHEYIFIFQKR